jgi:hypothetical protein
VTGVTTPTPTWSLAGNSTTCYCKIPGHDCLLTPTTLKSRYGELALSSVKLIRRDYDALLTILQENYKADLKISAAVSSYLDFTVADQLEGKTHWYDQVHRHYMTYSRAALEKLGISEEDEEVVGKIRYILMAAEEAALQAMRDAEVREAGVDGITSSMDGLTLSGGGAFERDASGQEE